jgi:hypothetical protein
MTDTNQEMALQHADNGGRRSGIERRRFRYTSHIPERRFGHERRSGLDRRSENGHGTPEGRSGLERRIIYLCMLDPFDP